MQQLKDAIRKRLAEKHLGRNMVGSVAVNTVNKWLQENNFVLPTINNEPLEGYVRFNKLFLKTIDPRLKIEIFKRKNELLKDVNEAIHKLGYRTTIVEIMFK